MRLECSGHAPDLGTSSPSSLDNWSHTEHAHSPPLRALATVGAISNTSARGTLINAIGINRSSAMILLTPLSHIRNVRPAPPAATRIPSRHQDPLRPLDAHRQVSEVTAVWLVRLLSGGRGLAMELLVCCYRFEATFASALFRSSAFMTGTNSISASSSR